jgi:uncharacterized protein (TIGR02646 family)
MTDYFVLDEAEMKLIFDDYKSQCHSDEKVRRWVMFNISRFHIQAINRFKLLQGGQVPKKRNLWSDFSNQNTKEKADHTAAVAPDEGTSGEDADLEAATAQTAPAPAAKKRRKRAKVATPKISDIKGAFRDFIAKEQGDRCCYCRRWLFKNGNAKPIEHILPRETYEHYSFHFWNLSVACVDCNGLKGIKDWSSPTKKNKEAYPTPASFTEMFHPRFHKYDDHIRFIRVQTNDHSITLYRGITRQGKKLCDDLLRHIAGKEVLVNANPALKASLDTIERFEVKEGSELEAVLQSLHGALSDRTFKLIQQ